MGCPAKDNLQMLGAILILTLIWLVAVICSAPLFIYRNLTHYTINITALDFEHTISYCTELWPTLPLFDGGVYYSIFSLALQYFIPILVVSSAYLKIYFRLKKRFVVSQNIPSVDDRIQNRRGRRMKRTNCLLISIALIFGISWLPLNFFNLYADVTTAKMNQNAYIIFAVCHMAGMSSGENDFHSYHLWPFVHTLIDSPQLAPIRCFTVGLTTILEKNSTRLCAALSSAATRHRRDWSCEPSTPVLRLKSAPTRKWPRSISRASCCSVPRIIMYKSRISSQSLRCKLRNK